MGHRLIGWPAAFLPLAPMALRWLIRPLAEPPAVAYRQRLVPSPIETEPEPRDQVDSEPFLTIAAGASVDLIRILIAIVLPPLGVFLQVGFGGAFWLNILLTLLGYLPGIIHAVWIIARR